MDWKRLVQFALLGSSELEQYAILLIRRSIGLFFASSGGHNCLSPAARNLDVFISTITGGKVTTDTVGPHADLLADFPYPGVPHKVRSAEQVAA
jgi:hypothetical protein